MFLADFVNHRKIIFCNLCEGNSAIKLMILSTGKTIWITYDANCSSFFFFTSNDNFSKMVKCKKKGMKERKILPLVWIPWKGSSFTSLV